jgi:hypothetical protein
MSGPSGFTYRRNKNGSVVVFHHGRIAASLNKSDSVELIDGISGADAVEVQHALARLTGNYKRGNERLAKSHNRNQD